MKICLFFALLMMKLVRNWIANVDYNEFECNAIL